MEACTLHGGFVEAWLLPGCMGYDCRRAKKKLRMNESLLFDPPFLYDNFLNLTENFSISRFAKCFARMFKRKNIHSNAEVFSRHRIWNILAQRHACLVSVKTEVALDLMLERTSETPVKTLC